VTHRGVRLTGARQGVGVEGIVFGFDHSALARIPIAGEALGDEPADACLARGSQQRVSALRSQAVGLREGAI